MAYSVSVNPENHAIATALEALLVITKTESYPNGNGGYSQSEIRRYARGLAPFGVNFEKVYSGNAVIVGVYKFTANENADTTAVRDFVINELRGWCANRKNINASLLHKFLKEFEAPRVRAWRDWGKWLEIDGVKYKDMRLDVNLERVLNALS